MEIIPAIDIRGGKCVRLYQGDYDAETVFSDEPLDVALKYQSAGAPRLHIVDLDGALEGEPVNLDLITQIATAILVPVQVGGGIRRLDTIEHLLKAGVERVVLGTAAVDNPRFVGEACRRFGKSIIVSIDAREGMVATHGWQQQTEQRVLELAQFMVQVGVSRFAYTDIKRDGTLTEPNFSAIFELAATFRVPVVAAGGISTINHIKMLKLLGIEGAVIGKALYTGDIDLKQALAAAMSQ